MATPSPIGPSPSIVDVDIRPVHHYLKDRVRAHAFLCFLATYVTFHLRDSLAPLTFTDTAQPERTDPVAPAPRSASAKAKDAQKKNGGNGGVRGFRELIEHLGTLTRNTIRVVGTDSRPSTFSPRPLRPSAASSSSWALRCRRRSCVARTPLFSARISWSKGRQPAPAGLKFGLVLLRGPNS